MARRQNISKTSSASKKSESSQGSIDSYSAQCEICLKWRLIDTPEKFEEIRHKVLEESFVCSKKANCSCEDPADIEYDDSSTWIMDKPNLPKTPRGFKRTLIMRKNYSKLDTYYTTPTSKRLRTRNGIEAYLKDHPEHSGISASEFVFSSPKVMQDTVPKFVELKDSGNKKLKISKDDV